MLGPGTRWLIAGGLMLLVTTGCGARTGASLPIGAGDAGTDPDSGPEDSGVDAADGSPPPDTEPLPDTEPPIDAGCRLEERTAPATIAYRETDEGSYDRPQVIAKGGGLYYLLSAFRTDEDDVTPFGNPYDGRFETVGGLSSPLGGLSQPPHNARLGEQLGYCFAGDGALVVAADASPPDMPGSETWRRRVGPPRARCTDLVGGESRWLVSYSVRFDTSDSMSFVQVLDDRGEPLRDPVRAFERTAGDRLSERPVQATALPGGGFAWTGPPTREGQLEIGILRDGSVQRAVIGETPPGPDPATPPAIAPWPYSGGALAVVLHGPGGVYAIVVDRDGDEILRTDPFAFSMPGDVTPALASMPSGFVVAMLNYGDVDPRGGMLELVSLGPGGYVGSSLDRGVRRASLQRGGIDVAVDGRRFVVHWNESGRPTREGDPTRMTKAMMLACLPATRP